MKALAERERPRMLQDVAGQDAAVAEIRRCIGDGTAGGRAWFISGASGTGKTTLARILAATVAGSLAVEESNGADLTVDDIRRMERDMQQPCLPSEPNGPTGRAWIINEAHLIRGLSLSRMLTTLEPEDGLPSGVCIVFTTTAVGIATMFGDHADASPLVSRCVELRLENDAESRKSRALWVRGKAVAAGCDGYAESEYVAAMDAVQGNTRMLAQRVEAGQLGKSREMAVAAPQRPKARLSPLPDEKTLKATPSAQLRAWCLERGLPEGWVKAASVSTMVQRLVKLSA